MNNTYVYVIFTVLLYFKDLKRNIFTKEVLQGLLFFHCEKPRFI